MIFVRSKHDQTCPTLLSNSRSPQPNITESCSCTGEKSVKLKSREIRIYSWNVANQKKMRVSKIPSLETWSWMSHFLKILFENTWRQSKFFLKIGHRTYAGNSTLDDVIIAFQVFFAFLLHADEFLFGIFDSSHYTSHTPTNKTESPDPPCPRSSPKIREKSPNLFSFSERRLHHA